MSGPVVYEHNKAAEADLAGHLRACDASFIPPLSGRVNIDEYAHKIFQHANRFEAWAEGVLVGLVAAYSNDEATRAAHITSVSVLSAWTGRGIAADLMRQSLAHARRVGMRQIGLEVAGDNAPAIKLYEKLGFVAGQTTPASIRMSLSLESGGNMRDYNTEMRDTGSRQYAYSFDFDVMHPYMIRSFEPFFRKGSLLELGSFKGDFTGRFLPYSDDITCVEASDVAISEARKKLGNRVTFVNSLFETATLPKRYDNVVLTHVLEHLDDPVRLLRRINDEWLADKGRLFLVCPNANAPSRQIAVKIGIISHNAAVTAAEEEHGHRCTYSLDTLERDAVSAGLRVVHRSGIFFKALANFQWDRLLQTDIISKEYLDGCYKLGQQYPDLCSSIFLMCERGPAL
ncbi:MAG: GNAT family N-acetyltransferase [Fimbriimonadaceae bacterium]|nr:GNAT family N-acetyltransferase [Fimbriimonadaceae bacterium]